MSEQKKRNFPNFLEAYYNYAKDDFCPDAFHLWTGISIVAGAIGRKLWIPFSETLKFYPNLYVLLVAKPGEGKSSAANIGVNGILREIKGINFIPSQVTEAKFVDLMSEQSHFEMNGRNYLQSAGYFYASEASNSLKNHYGDFLACITDFYDCPAIWEKATKKDDRITLTNVCFNLLAGCTFDYLGKLVTEENIMGGFASRLIYVINDKEMDRDPVWGMQDKKEDGTKQKLIEDLQDIQRMCGQFTADDEFKEIWKTWFRQNDKAMRGVKSEKMRSLMARKSPNLIKVSMIMSAVESSDKVLRARHWSKALELVTHVEKELPLVIQETMTGPSPHDDQRNLNVAITSNFVGVSTGLPLQEIVSKALVRGFRNDRIQATIRSMMENGQMRYETVEGKGRVIKLLMDPQEYM